MLLTVPQGGSAGTFAVTSVQAVPPFRVTWMRPSFVPAQIVPFSIGDSAMAKTTPAYSTPTLSGLRPPEISWRSLSLRVRSGLMRSQLLPPFTVRCTIWLPAYIVFRSWGDIARGNVHWKRYSSFSAGQPTVLSGQISTRCTCLVFSLKRSTIPPTLPRPDAVAQTMSLSMGSGMANPLSPPPTECHRLLGIGPGPSPENPAERRPLEGPRGEGPSRRVPQTLWG